MLPPAPSGSGCSTHSRHRSVSFWCRASRFRDIAAQVSSGARFGLRVLREAGEAVKDQAAGHRHVEAGAIGDHRDLDARVGGLDVLSGDALGLVAEQHDGWLSGGRQTGKRDRVVGQFDGEDLPAGLALESDPAVLAGGDPVDAAALGETARVADGQRVAVVRGVGDCDARAGGVTRDMCDILDP
jgi:hypothetical protein